MGISNPMLDIKSPRIMGVLNITPDSFSDGGKYIDVDAAVERALTMVNQGASIIDVGGESTRPGAKPITAEEELSRVIPVIKALHSKSDVSISIDTSKPEVMQEAVLAGATLINDVYALRQSGALEMAAKLNVPVCLMHMQGTPKGMQERPAYQDVLKEVKHFLNERIIACEQVGISKNKIILDPGFGFGKSLQHNLTLLTDLLKLQMLGCPILVGLSRKSMLGAILDKPVEKRLSGSLALALIAVQNGASIVRVHDVAETSDVLAVYHAVSQVR